MKTFRKILVPTDFSRLSYAAVNYAKPIAVRYGARLYIIHVVDNLPSTVMHTLDLDVDTVMRNAEERARAQLKNFVSSRLRGIKKVTPVVKLGEPHEEIVKFVKKGKVDLIVLATHGRTGLAHMLIGSVAEKVVRHSPVPVLTVKPGSMR